jgi:sulfide:quinone oxidoreductase
MKPVVLTDVLAVGEFPTPDQVAILAKAGFKSILNNQPDGEVARFETDAEVAAEAKRHGLAHAYAPLSSRTPPAEELERYAKAIATLPAPIYGFCYSGSRAAAACAFLLTATTDVDAIMRQFDEAGFDLRGLKPWLEEEQARHAPKRAAAQQTVQAAAEAPPATATPVERAASAPTNGNGPKPMNGTAAHAEGAVAARQAESEPGSQHAAALPHAIVVQPRASGYGGFAR